MVIVTSDHTRPLPSHITLPILLKRIRKAEPGISITLLVGTGFHRGTTQKELVEKFGAGIVENEKIVIHDSRDDRSMIRMGILPSGGEFWLNRLAVETDLLIAEGFIEPHFFAGFSGGRKSILPGIAGAATVLANHCSEFIAHPKSRTGILDGNPIHIDMVYAARKAGLQFILNVILNDRKRIIHAVAGEMEKAHAEGCRFLKSLASAAPVGADIVITSNGGYPLDQNIYQAVKGMSAAEATCRKGGIIIMVSACHDGHGGDSFYENMASSGSPEKILAKTLKISRNETVPDQWEFQILARILCRCRVILVTDMCDPEMIRAMHMEPAKSIDEAMDKAFSIAGEQARIAVIPDGVSVIIGD
jgi:nickel-dependent lactate racemase